MMLLFLILDIVNILTLLHELVIHILWFHMMMMNVSNMYLIFINIQFHDKLLVFTHVKIKSYVFEKVIFYIVMQTYMYMKDQTISSSTLYYIC